MCLLLLRADIRRLAHGLSGLILGVDRSLVGDVAGVGAGRDGGFWAVWASSRAAVFGRIPVGVCEGVSVVRFRWNHHTHPASKQGPRRPESRVGDAGRAGLYRSGCRYRLPVPAPVPVPVITGTGTGTGAGTGTGTGTGGYRLPVASEVEVTMVITARVVGEISLAALWVLLLSGPCFGFNSLYPVLYSEGLFVQSCGSSAAAACEAAVANTTAVGLPCCDAQSKKMVTLSTMTLFAEDSILVVYGELQDRFGARCTLLVASSILCASLCVLTINSMLQDSAIELLWYVGFFLMGLAGPGIFLAALSLGEKHGDLEPVITPVIASMFDASSLVFLLWSALYQSGQGLAFHVILIAWLALTLLLSLAVFVLLPGKGNSEHVAHVGSCHSALPQHLAHLGACHSALPQHLEHLGSCSPAAAASWHGGMAAWWRWHGGMAAWRHGGLGSCSPAATAWWHGGVAVWRLWLRPSATSPRALLIARLTRQLPAPFHSAPPQPC